MSVNVILTNNYQERHEDLQETNKLLRSEVQQLQARLKECENELAIVKMDYEEDEEMIKNMGAKMKKLEGENRKLKAEARKGKEDEV